MQQASVRNAISSLVGELEKESGCHATDILRSLQLEAQLLFQQNVAKDCLDADTFGIFVENDKLRDDIKKRMRVTSYDRLATRDGRSSISAVVVIENSENSSPENNLELTFSYDRHHIKYISGQEFGLEDDNHLSTNSNSRVSTKELRSSKKKRKLSALENDFSQMVTPVGTHVVYRVDLKRGHEKNEQFLKVEVKASSRDPSIDEHVGIIGEDFEQLIDDRGEDMGGNSTTEESSNFAFIDDGKDRFQAVLDPEILVKFLELSKLEFNDVTDAVRFLLALPYYEHEWDIAGYVHDILLNCCDDEEDDLAFVEVLCDGEAEEFSFGAASA